MANKDTVKNWFKRGLKPLETQFAQTFDWLRWKDEAIQQSDIGGLSDSLAAKAEASALIALQQRFLPTELNISANTQFVVPNGYSVEKIMVLPSLADTVRIGTFINGDDLYTDTLLVSGSPNWFSGSDFYANGSDRTIYISGISASAKIVIYKR